MKMLFRKILRECARTIVSIYKPRIIAITGSVGKTSTKAAIAAVLDADHSAGSIRVAQGSFNTDWGVPITVIGGEYPGGSAWRWLGVMLRALRLILWRDRAYPTTLVLEMGADRKGDIGRLVSIAPPTVAIVTAIAPAHLERFGSLEAIAREKLRLLKALPSNGTAIVSSEVSAQWSLKEWSRAPIVVVGNTSSSDGLFTSDIHYRAQSRSTHARGTTFKLHWKGSVIPCFLPDVVGESAVASASLAAAVGIVEGIGMLEVTQRLSHSQFPAGRMHLLEGVRNSMIIDDSYNASPQAMIAALAVIQRLAQTEGRSTWAVLGDMAELGSSTEEFHRQVGKFVAESAPTRLVTVGPNARFIALQAIESGYPVEQVRRTTDAWEAGRMVQQDMREGDLILVKGSQVMRMERVTKELMANPLDAKTLLVRQEWWWR